MLNKVKNLNEKQYRNFLLDLTKEYDEATPSITDEEFDVLVKIYEDKFNAKFEEEREDITSKKIKLPYPLWSLDKIKENEAEKKLELFKKKYKGPYNISDKLDGIAGLYVVKHIKGNYIQSLYTKHKGRTVGSDISRIIPCLKLPIPDIDVVIRGEIILPLRSFEQYVNEEKQKGTKNKLNNPRNVGAGIVRSSIKDNFNIQACSKLSFIAFQILSENDLGQNDQYVYLNKHGFNIPWNIVKDDINVDILRKLLLQRKHESPYDVDGLVISPAYQHYDFPLDSNPKHQIAFKLDSFVNTIVRDVTWTAKQYGKLKPVVHFDPVFISGATVEKAYAHNAKFIVDNFVGPGAEVIVTRGGEVIPDVVDVVTPASEPKLPDYAKHEYKWNKSHVEFVLVNPESDPDVKMSNISYFVSHMGIENLGPGRIKALYDIGIETVKDLLKADVRTIASADRMGLKSAQTIYNNIRDKIINAPLENVMTSSQVFGPGFGTGKIKHIVDSYPDILDYSNAKTGVVSTMLSDIGGFSKMAKIFEKRLPNFKKWLEEHSMITILPNKLKVKLDMNKFNGKVIVFTGFTNEYLKKQIENQGGYVLPRFRKKIDILVAKDISKLTKKMQSALEHGVIIISLSDFLKKYDLRTKEDDYPTILKQITQAIIESKYDVAAKLSRMPVMHGAVRLKTYINYLNNIEILEKFNKQIFNDFYYDFLVDLLVNDENIIEYIDRLGIHITNMVKKYEEDIVNIKIVINEVINNMLYPDMIILNKYASYWKSDMLDLYCSMRGFFMLLYIPEYTHIEILEILKNENHSSKGITLASQLIAVYLNDYNIF